MDKHIHFYPSDTNCEGTTNNVHIHIILFKQVAGKLQDLCREPLDIVTYQIYKLKVSWFQKKF